MEVYDQLLSLLYTLTQVIMFVIRKVGVVLKWAVGEKGRKDFKRVILDSFLFEISQNVRS